MADLYASVERDVPRDRTLRLAIEWRDLRWDSDFPEEAYGTMQIGLFIGTRPLFSDYIYSGGRGHRGMKFPPGFFYGEDAQCAIFAELYQTLTTGQAMRFESNYDPHFMLHIGTDIFSSEYAAPEEDDHYEVLMIVEYGGPWHGLAMSQHGPAAFFHVARSDLVVFRRTLLDEAVGLEGADPRAVDILRTFVV